MSITYTISAGVPTAIAQNVVWALPPRKVTVLATAAVEHSADNSNWTALTAANTVSAPTAAGWLRCTTTGGATVVVKVD